MDKEPTVAGDSDSSRIDRRLFMVGATSLGASVSLPGCSFLSGNGDVSLDPHLQDPSEVGTTTSPDTRRHWLGPEFWGNRLQDWRYNHGRIECLRGEAGYELRTVAALTREISPGNKPGHLRVTTGISGSDDGDGLSGFLLGTGTSDLDYRAAALTQRSSGVGGGLLCTYETDGHVRFRDHTNERTPIAYETLPITKQEGPAPDPTSNDEIRLLLDILPQSDATFTIVLKAIDKESGTLRAAARCDDISEDVLTGGISLVSSPLPKQDGPRWWFKEFTTSGAKIATFPKRTFGPIAGTLFSIDTRKSLLKLTTQLLPVGKSAPNTIRLQYRSTNNSTISESWHTEHAKVTEGYTSCFRVEDWDTTQSWEYRVNYTDETETEWQYEGTIPADPKASEETTIALFSCTSATGRRLDESAPTMNAAGTAVLGRYTPANIYFPYPELTKHASSHDPDLLLFVGDQFYEQSPTRKPKDDNPKLDFLYRWLLWVWSFRTLTRDTPTIILSDDHDVYQPNLWGSGGDTVSKNEDRHDGGYTHSPEFVTLAQRIQCGHNPDPYDLTPINNRINVYYGSFTYGGVNFALLTGRKFKDGPSESRWFWEDKQLIGDRQAKFLAQWATRDDGLPRICVTQTIFASARTTPDGELKGFYDTNGWPKQGRDRAIKLLRDAGALIVAGDQHLPSLVRHGITTFTDGPVQFTGPAGAAVYPRWFEPNKATAAVLEQAYTGEFTDPFGNKFRMLAVKNPDISKAQFDQYNSGDLYDREMRPEGYGIVRADHDVEKFVIECWPWFENPTADDATQYPGWPYRLAFDETNGN